MTEGSEPTGAGWFASVDPGDVDAASRAIREGGADEPADWPSLAVDAGAADSPDDYYDYLHEATMAATRSEVRERERADDQQLIHAIRAMDDCRRTANELAERLAEWAGTVDADAGTGVEYARDLVASGDGTGHATGDVADRTGGDDAADPAAGGDDTAPAADRRLHSLAERIVALDDEADALREFVERRTPAAAPNLAAMAGPVLAARLLSLAGGLEELAKQPSGTVQVLGAEDALFAHLRGHAPSPKHGIIYTHDGVRGTRPEDRGSAARAVAGKLAIAARVDHYSGDYRPELEAELEERLATIRARAGDSNGDGTDGTGATEDWTDGSGDSSE